MFKLAILAYVSAEAGISSWSNPVPIQTEPVGWHYMGSKEAPVKIHLIYDMLCLDCVNTNRWWHELIDEKSPVSGYETFADMVDITASPLVLSYHYLSYEMT